MNRPPYGFTSNAFPWNAWSIWILRIHLLFKKKDPSLLGNDPQIFYCHHRMGARAIFMTLLHLSQNCMSIISSALGPWTCLILINENITCCSTKSYYFSLYQYKKYCSIICSYVFVFLHLLNTHVTTFLLKVTKIDM